MSNDGVSKSSIVTRALDAKTFGELQAFVKDLESRPTERLLRDLPELIQLSDAKADMIIHVVLGRYRHSGDEDRAAILERVSELFETAAGADRERYDAILSRLRA